MGYNLTYDVPYSNKVRKELNSYGNQDVMEPESFTLNKLAGLPPPRMVGGSVFKNESNWVRPEIYQKKSIYRSGNVPAWTYYNRNVLDNVNRMDLRRHAPPFQGGAVSIDVQPERPLMNSVIELSTPSKSKIPGQGTCRRPGRPRKQQKEGGVDLKKAKKTVKKVAKKAKPVAKFVASRGLDVAVPALATIGAQSVGVPAPVGTVVGKVARKGIEELTGLGEPQQGGVNVKKTARKAKRVAKKALPLAKFAVSTGLDAGIPAIVETGLETVGAPKPVGKVVGKVARKGVKELTGFGETGIGMYTGGSLGIEKKIAKELLKGQPTPKKVHSILTKHLDQGSQFSIGNIAKALDLVDANKSKKFIKMFGGSSIPDLPENFWTLLNKATADAFLKHLLPKLTGKARSGGARSASARSAGARSAGAKKPNYWISFVKKYAKDHNMKYGEALKCKELKKAYEASKK